MSETTSATEVTTTETTQHPLVGRTLVIKGQLDQKDLEEFAELYEVELADITPELIVQKVTEDIAEGVEKKVEVEVV